MHREKLIERGYSFMYHTNTHRTKALRPTCSVSSRASSNTRELVHARTARRISGSGRGRERLDTTEERELAHRPRPRAMGCGEDDKADQYRPRLHLVQLPPEMCVVFTADCCLAAPDSAARANIYAVL